MGLYVQHRGIASLYMRQLLFVLLWLTCTVALVVWRSG